MQFIIITVALLTQKECYNGTVNILALIPVYVYGENITDRSIGAVLRVQQNITKHL